MRSFSALLYHCRWFRVVGLADQIATSVYFLQLGYCAVHLACQITSRYAAQNNITKIENNLCRERADIAIPLVSPRAFLRARLCHNFRLE